MATKTTPNKKPLPKPGKPLSLKDSLKRINARYGKALAKLAK